MDREISKIAEQLITKHKLQDETIKTILEVFFDFVRKNNIKMGTKSEDGVGIISNNPEWTMCLDTFIMAITQQIQFALIFLDDVPDDLQAY